MERRDGNKRVENEFPIVFYCPQGVIGCIQVVKSTGLNVQEARAKIPDDQVPSCTHGKMRSAPRTMRSR